MPEADADQCALTGTCWTLRSGWGDPVAIWTAGSEGSDAAPDRQRAAKVVKRDAPCVSRRCQLCGSEGEAMRNSLKDTDCLFVYGTLMIASGHAMAARLARESKLVGPATAPGRLYDLGAYPGAVATDTPSHRIHGQLIRLSHPERSIPWLDAYEGCGEDDPEPRSYQRVLAPVRLMTGRQVDAWIYYYRGALGRARLIAVGRYSVRKPLFCLPS